MSAIAAMTIDEALRDAALYRANRDSRATTELRDLIGICRNRIAAGVPQEEAVADLIADMVTFVGSLGSEDDFAELIAEAEDAARRAEDAAADAEDAAARLARLKGKGAK